MVLQGKQRPVDADRTSLMCKSLVILHGALIFSAFRGFFVKVNVFAVFGVINASSDAELYTASFYLIN